MPEGTIKAVKLDRGFGFIEPAGGERTGDVFFHVYSLSEELPFDEMLQQRRVRFEMATDPRTGKPRAINIRPAS